MDEVAGFCPPTAEPPSKKPILTLAKQARAFGYGMVLTTQNPMDFDYKVMSNAGTWMIGRLQTERDKARILEGMQTASGGIDLGELDMNISGLDKRQFVLHTSRGKPPVVFTTRWAMSYLAGPLTKDQLSRASGSAGRSPGHLLAEALATGRASSDLIGATRASRPSYPDGGRTRCRDARPRGCPGTQSFLPGPGGALGGQGRSGRGSVILKPVVAATVNLLYDEAPAKIEHREVFEAILTSPGEPLTRPECHRGGSRSSGLPESPPGRSPIHTTGTTDERRPVLDGAQDRTDRLPRGLPPDPRVEEPGPEALLPRWERESDFRARCIEVANEQC